MNQFYEIPVRKGKIIIEGEDENGEWISVEFFKFDSTHSEAIVVAESDLEKYDKFTKQVERVGASYSLSVDVELLVGGSPNVGQEAMIYNITRRGANS